MVQLRVFDHHGEMPRHGSKQFQVGPRESFASAGNLQLNHAEDFVAAMGAMDAQRLENLSLADAIARYAREELNLVGDNMTLRLNSISLYRNQRSTISLRSLHMNSIIKKKKDFSVINPGKESFLDYKFH